MTEEKELTPLGQLIEQNLTLNTKMFRDNREEIILELGPILNLMNHVGEDPGAVLNLLMKAVLAIKLAANSVMHDRDRLAFARDAMQSGLYMKYGSTDEDINPYAKTAKLTQKFIESAVKQDEAFNELDSRYQDLKYLTGVLYSIKDVLELELEAAKDFAVNPSSIPVGGILLNKSDIVDQLERFTKSFEN